MRAAEPSFGIASFAVTRESDQAGAHSNLSTEFAFNTEASGEPVDQVKDVSVTLPTGSVGDPLATPRCTPAEFEVYGCQPPAQVGVMHISFVVGTMTIEPVSAAVYNLVPTPGHIATLAASFLFETMIMQVDMTKDGSYKLAVSLPDISTLLPIAAVKLTLWGVPASPAHDLERSRTELGGPQPIYGPPNELGESEVIGFEPTPAGVAPAPFLTNPTDCASSSLTSTLSVDSYENPGDYVTQTAPTAPLTGCELLKIAPAISVVPETAEADVPSGYDIDLSYPLNEEPYALATPDLQNAEVTLPVGTSLSPAAASGLQGCSQEQFSAEACPSASTVGTVAIATPVLSQPLTGTVSLASPTPSEMYRVFLSASSESVSFHLVGDIHLDPNTGQVTMTLTQAPQLPFSEIRLHLFGGPQAIMANPAACGPATSIAQFASYAGQTANVSSSFVVDSGGAGGVCSTAGPFNAHVVAGSTFPLAGEFSPFTLTVSREDGEQNLASVAAQLPPGLLGMLSRVPPCVESEAAAAECPGASQIGTATVGAGAGAQPLYLSGAIYLTGPYKGAPFGLAIVVPADAGPYNLGTIVVRSRILVNSADLHLTIISDSLPEILDGVPLRLRAISLAITRPGFMFNPTNCSPRSIITTIGSAGGTTATAATPFQVGGCKGLPFAPKLSASTRARASRRGDGASLEVSITNTGASQANIKAVTVELPQQLRPRLSTIQGACLQMTFEVDPTRCPVTSVVGSVSATTPLLASSLSSPIYLVSRGAALPALMMVPQDQGIKLELAGTVKISRAGVIGVEFDALADVPLSALRLAFPYGRHSLLGATVSLCSKALDIAYAVTGQNGIRIRRTTRVGVVGCAKRRRPRTAA